MLGNALWACGRLNDVIDWSGVVEGVGRRAIIDDKMLPHHIAHFMWGSASCYSVATEDRQREQIVELVKKVMMEFFRRDGTGFESRHIANIVWSLGTIQLPLSSDFLLRLLNSCTAVSSHLKDQEDSNTIWGLARLSAVAPPPAGDGVHAIRRYIVGRVLQRTSWAGLRPEEFAMILWGVAVGVGQEADAIVLERLSAAASTLAGKMVSEPSSHRAIANTLWAFATLRHADDNLLRFASLACPAVVQSDSGRHLSNIVLALIHLVTKGNLCVKNNKHLSERVKEELEIDIKDTDKYSCRHFHLSSTKKGLRLQTPLFGVTEAFGEPVSLSGEPLEVINNQGMGTKNHYVVVNMYLMGVSGESVEVMGWFDVKPASTRETLKTVMENDIFNSSD
ncbi:hypothetical protein FOZ60_015859 [Perkinsus olseni]|uniref:Uncharacterized protein n=1 Tax=Perkinsus olseni TaxID=32597 RepID=A0A7J6N644_PEROL|nr:hypothetical protein FOZ60_015859 [Perkinsus olseni]